MNKNIKLILLMNLLVIFVFSCGNQRYIYSHSKILEIFKQKIKNKQRNTWSHKELLENKNELKYRYSIAMHSDSIFSISYKPEQVAHLGSIINKIDFESKEWKNTEDDIINFLLREEKNEMEQVFIYGRKIFPKLPVFHAKIENYSTLKKLSERTDVIKIAPHNTEIFESLMYIPFDEW